MITSITKFIVVGLHGNNTRIEVPVEANKLVLVGENGAGKSTFANLLYYTLTQQWRRLLDYKFTELQVMAGGDVVRLTLSDVAKLEEVRSAGFPRRLRYGYSGQTMRSLFHAIETEDMLYNEVIDSSSIERISANADVPREVAWEFINEYRRRNTSKLKKPLIHEVKRLESWKFGQFLYLPTYRRIEQDLKSIFRGLEIEDKVKEFREKLKDRERAAYVELIEFGMEDVQKTIQTRMSQIKERVRTGLSNLTGTYLREVIRGLQDNPDLSSLRAIDPKSLQSMFARIDEATLPAADKRLLQDKILEISGGYSVGADDKVIAHFLSKLVSLYNEQQRNESDVRDFITLCNGYLTGKRFVYDEVKYEIGIEPTGVRKTLDGSDGLSLKVLSSGEKQIVSLFSHIYFSGESSFFVVIDEPELSLSVPWQQKFLPDIIKTGRCNGIVAVTHSPFIWENELERNVVSLADHIVPIS